MAISSYILIGLSLPLVALGFYCISRLYRFKAIEDDQCRQVSKLLQEKWSTIRSYQKCIRLLESHMTDHILSLGAEAGRIVLEIRKNLSLQTALSEQIASWLTSRDLVAPEESEKVLQGYPPSFLRQNETIVPPKTTSMRILAEMYRYRNWEKETEALLQDLGRRIAEASKRASAFGLQKREGRRSTKQSLEEARILIDN